MQIIFLRLDLIVVLLNKEQLNLFNIILLKLISLMALNRKSETIPKFQETMSWKRIIN